MAKLDLSELLLGQRYMYMCIPVHNCSSPDPNVGHDRPGGSIVGHAGSVDGPGTPKSIRASMRVNDVYHHCFINLDK